LIRLKGHLEALIIELGSLNYAKVGAKMTNLEGNGVYVPGATDKGPDYIYFGAKTFLPDLNGLFDKSPQGEEEEV
jgi:pre-mRNA-splicing factor ISY1